MSKTPTAARKAGVEPGLSITVVGTGRVQSAGRHWVGESRLPLGDLSDVEVLTLRADQRLQVADIDLGAPEAPA